jgi:para-aminobenzoate synthetase component 1
MIIDVERNDLGKICEIGSVKVKENSLIEVHPTVFHKVATVEGILRKDKLNPADILEATFPSGSVTGAPKIRAMEIIDELEPNARNFYTGALGWIGLDGTMDLSMAIRILMIKDGYGHLPVGSGVVWDSTPEKEYEETLVKGKELLMAILGTNHLSSIKV